MVSNKQIKNKTKRFSSKTKIRKNTKRKTRKTIRS